MDLESKYDIAATANFIRTHNYTRVALQFPDDMLKDSTRVVSALRAKLQALAETSTIAVDNYIEDFQFNYREFRLFVMADTAYGSCCVDEVGASHVNAHCVIHYGHTCLSPTTTLPALFVFGKASIDTDHCIQNISQYALTKPNPIVVLYDLEYAHAVGHIRQAISELLGSSTSELKPEVHFADVRSPIMHPLDYTQASVSTYGLSDVNTTATDSDVASTSRYSIGGLSWNLPIGQSMRNSSVFWIGPNNSAFSHVVLTLNECEIVRYDATENQMVVDVSQQKRILNRRYYLVERARDANIVGVLVGTLGVAGYLHMIHQVKGLIAQAGKKAYTLVMGRPNPAKLANFPECDVFVYVSCAQTALLDSKEYLAPVITPFEAMLAFSRGSQWTGEYVMEFQYLMKSPVMEMRKVDEEARFSFLQGGYVEDIDLQENEKEENEDLALVDATEKALRLYENSKSLVKGKAKSGAQFLASRSYQGLNINHEELSPEPYLIGRSGRAAAYDNEVGDHVGS